MLKRVKKAFTVIEVMIVLGVVGILFLLGFNMYNQTHLNSQIDVCESNLRDMATGFQGYITDYGKIDIPPNEDVYEDAVNQLINTLNTRYLEYSIGLVSVADDCTSFTARTEAKTDPWNKLYTISIYTNSGESGINPGTNIPGMIVISSPGPDAASNMNNYDENYSDDIIAVINPNVM